jgi:cytochrome c oxidase assembly protein subunit 11
MSQPDPSELRRNKRVAIVCAGVFFGMLGMAFAAVPLYRAFCQITGFDGTTQRAQAAPGGALGRKILIRFDANVRELPWDFKADQVSQEVRIGETGLAIFHATNTGSRPVTGRAVFNVVPESAGVHFQKIECFCFTSQTIQPGQTVEFPVVYFVDPKFATDSETRDEPEITLSYTFFPAVGSAVAGAGR